MVLFVYQAKFKANQAFAHILVRRLVRPLDHHIVECVASQEPSSERLAFDSHVLQVAPLPSHERLLIVVSLTADRAKPFLDALVPLESLKVFQTVPVVHVTARQNRLVSKLQMFKTDRAWLVDLRSAEELVLNFSPIGLAEGYGRLINEAETFC